MQRLHFKKSIADAAVDGVVPEGHLRSPGQAYQDVMGWLQRLDDGGVETITRRVLQGELPSPDSPEYARRRRQFGDFSRMNQRWNRARSSEIHARLQEHPDEWEHYHALYREARRDWALVPYDEMVRWYQHPFAYWVYHWRFRMR